MKKHILKSIYVLGLVLTSTIIFAQAPLPPEGVGVPLDSSFLPITLAVGVVALLARRKKKQ